MVDLLSSTAIVPGGRTSVNFFRQVVPGDFCFSWSRVGSRCCSAFSATDRRARAAGHAGRAHAIIDTTTNNVATPAYVAESSGVTPNNSASAWLANECQDIDTRCAKCRADTDLARALRDAPGEQAVRAHRSISIADGINDVCDSFRNIVTWIRQAPRATFTETTIAGVAAPAHVEPVDRIGAHHRLVQWTLNEGILSRESGLGVWDWVSGRTWLH